MSRTGCPLCGNDGTAPLRRRCRNRAEGLPERFDLFRCGACRVVFLSPQPPESLLSRLYAEGYHSHVPSRASSGPALLFQSVAKALCLFPYRLRFGSEKCRLAPTGEGRLLDIGCGTGENLQAMARQGWRCFGCDPSEAALRDARQKVPQAVLSLGRFEKLPFENSSFEAVTLFHSLEHFSDPAGALGRVRNLLAPGGRLVIALPNIDSWEARLGGRRWVEMDIPGHLFFFSASTLSDLLGKTGLRVLRIRPQAHPSTVSDAAGFFLDDLFRIPRSRQRLWLYILLYPATAVSYALGNWGCIEVIAEKG